MSTPDKVYVWIDPEGDFLEVIFEVKDGDFESTEDGALNVKYDEEGNILGFHIIGVSKFKGPPFEVELTAKKPARVG